MAQFKKTYPLTKSTLTINYPDGLLEVIDKPRNYLSRDEWDQAGGDAYYPDVIVVPKNGSFVNSKMTFKRKVAVYMNDNGTETLLSNEPETSEQCVEPFGGEEMFWHDDATQKNDQCSSLLCFTPISVLNHAEWQLQQDKADGGGWYLRHQYQITINISGKPNFFKSNATRFFCHGQSESDRNGKVRFGISQTKKMIGWVGVKEKNVEDAKVIDLKLVNIGKLTQRKCKNRTYTFSKMETRTLGTSGQSRFIPKSTKDYSEDMDKEKENTTCDGCFYEMGLVNQLPDDSGTYNMKGKYIYFGDDQIVAVQLYPPGRSSGYIEMTGKISEEENPDIVDFPKFVVRKTNDTFKLPVDFPYVKYYIGRNEKIFHVRSKNFRQMVSKMKLTNNAGLSFNRYLVTDTFTQYNQPFYLWLLRTETPCFEWGLNVFPVFTTPKVSYLKLNCTPAADQHNVLGNENTNVHGYILNAIDNFGIMKEEKNVDSYPNGKQTLMDELKALKNSKSKFKILYVNCHGGKYSDTDESYGALDNQPGGGSVLFDYNALKYLLKGRTRNDEYYFIHFSSCFGGGFCENQVHNNVTSSNYTVTTAASELGNRMMIWYNDCANSPAWVGPRVLGDMFNLSPGSEETYSTQAAKINSLVTQGRQKNIQLLVDFMRNNYQMIREMINPSLFQWTQQTYNDSITYAGNLLIFASRQRDEGKALAMKYPIVYIHLNMIRAICSEGTAVSALPIKPDITFTEFTTDQKYFVPIVNKFMNVNRSLVKQTQIQYLSPQFYNMIKSNPMKEKLKKYMMLFKNLYVCCCKMDVNTHQIQKLNRTYNFQFDGTKHGYDMAWMLDDTPGVIDRCGSDYGGNKWPYCPGIDENSQIDRQFMELSTFKRST